MEANGKIFTAEEYEGVMKYLGEIQLLTPRKSILLQYINGKKVSTFSI